MIVTTGSLASHICHGLVGVSDAPWRVVADICAVVADTNKLAILNHLPRDRGRVVVAGCKPQLFDFVVKVRSVDEDEGPLIL